MVPMGETCARASVRRGVARRDLSVAGRAVVAKADGSGFESRLVRIDRPILRVPSLAIHLNREVNSEGLKLNAESHLAPVLATVLKTALEGPATAGAATAPATTGAAAGGAGAPVAGTGGALTRHHTSLVRVIAAEMGVAPEAVSDWDLSVFDTQPAAIGGLHDEFIFAGERAGAWQWVGGGGGQRAIASMMTQLGSPTPLPSPPSRPPVAGQRALTTC
jgi:aspartyl aminopeptidase